MNAINVLTAFQLCLAGLFVLKEDYIWCILGDPGAVSRVGRKGGTKVFITGERAPGYRLSTDHFQKFKRMPAPDWAQKMLCIIVPNRRTHLNKFFSCVLTWRLLSRSTQSGNFQFDIKSPSDPTRLLWQMQANSSEPYQSSWRENEFCYCLFTSFTKREIWHFHE